MRLTQKKQKDRRGNTITNETKLAQLKQQERIFENQIAKLTGQLNSIQDGSVLEETP